MDTLRVKDHSVSKEFFELTYNSTLDMLVTTPQPKEEVLATYYETEDYISHTDSKRNFFEKLYHLVRKHAIKNKINLLNSLTTKGNFLDIGCGTGDVLLAAKNNGWTITGIEPNAKARAIANFKTDNNVYNIDALHKLPENSFDVISLWHVLEHLPDLDKHINQFKKLLKPEGKLLIAVPNYKSYDACYYKEFWAAYDVPRHLWHFSQNSIRLLFDKFNMKINKVLPMKFDSFYVSLLSEQYKTGKKNFIKAFYIGLVSNFKAKKSKEYSSLIYVITKH